MSVPRHIAIIMDGNGRWAKERGLPKIMGHRQGTEAVKEIVDASIKFGVKYLTLYAFSTENWKRVETEVKSLFKLLEYFLDTQANIFHKNNVKVCIIGEKERFEIRLREKIERLEKDTAGNNALTLNIALSYGARQEILRAVKMLAELTKKGVIEPSEIDEKLFSGYLYTKDSPDPDLLIRTSGEMRVSNFLLWQISYAEIYITKKLWPDFHEADLKEAIDECQKRRRKFGR